MSMSSVSLVGYVVRNPEQICFASGKVKTQLIIAVNSASPKNKAGESSSDFYKIETWGKLAELAQQYLNKGSKVGVTGRLIMEHWTDKNGQDRLTPVVAATQISFPPRIKTAGTKKSGEQEDLVETDDDLFAGARAITVAEPPPHYYRSRSKNKLPLAANH